MKRITITYRMSKPGEDAENCITVPMSDEMAAGIAAWDAGETSRAAQAAYSHADMLCFTLAEMAGYQEGSYLGSELAARQYEEVDC